MEKIMLPQVRDLGQTIGDPFLFVRANFKPLFRGFLYYAVPPLLIAVGLSAFGFKSLMGHPGGTNALLTGYRGISSLGGMIVLAYLVFILTSIFQQLYVSEFMILKEEKEDVTNAEVMSRLKGDWKVVLLTYLMMIPIGLVVGGLLVLLFMSSAVLGAWVTGLAIFFFYLFLIYSIIPLMNILFVRLRERLGLVDSLIKCFSITRGNWWRTFTAWFVVFMIFYMLMIALMIPFIGISAVVDLHKLSSGGGTGGSDAISKSIMGVSITLGSFAFFFIMNLVNVFVGINYFSLSERHDSYHLKKEINEIGVREDRNVHRQEGEY